MSSFIAIIFIAISLSMDAFSLALAYGMSKISHPEKLLLSTVVGIYHFIMPLIGLLVSKILIEISFLNINYIAVVILIYTGIDLIISREDHKSINKLGYLMFGLSVSLDSFSIGISLRAITEKYLLAAISFSLSSFIFTYLGLNLGSTIGNIIGSFSKKIGGIILIIIAIICFIY